MRSDELKVLNEMPFLFWAKDEEGTYVWGNKTINDFAGENVVGKTDYELQWSADADRLREDDKRVWKTGKTEYVHEYVDRSKRGRATLNVCKFIGDLDGKRCVFGVSFVIED